MKGAPVASYVYRNASGERRRWDLLADPETGRTLEMDPGEEVCLDVKVVGDPHLVLVDDKPKDDKPKAAPADRKEQS